MIDYGIVTVFFYPDKCHILPKEIYLGNFSWRFWVNIHPTFCGWITCRVFWSSQMLVHSNKGLSLSLTSRLRSTKCVNLCMPGQRIIGSWLSKVYIIFVLVFIIVCLFVKPQAISTILIGKTFPRIRSLLSQLSWTLIEVVAPTLVRASGTLLCIWVLTLSLGPPTNNAQFLNLPHSLSTKQLPHSSSPYSASSSS